MARGKWGKRVFENQTIYTPPGGGVEYVVASGSSRLRIYWAHAGSVSLHNIGNADTMAEAFKEIRRVHHQVFGIASKPNKW